MTETLERQSDRERERERERENKENEVTFSKKLINKREDFFHVPATTCKKKEIFLDV